MMLQPWRLLFVGLLCLGSAAVAVGDDAADVEFFERKIRPVLVTHCYECHSADAKKIEGELRLDSRQAMRQGGASGPAVVPGDLEASLILGALRHDTFQMPPKAKLANRVVADFETWIRQGAVDPREAAKSEQAEGQPAGIDFERGKKFWAFQPPESHDRPEVKQQDWPHGQIDYFTLAAMEKQDLAPARPADRRTLARRVYYDLIGLPPTPEELEEFVGDNDEAAYEKLVDRLLSSPRYGEKWARLWLDVARYAEDQAHIVGDNKSLFFPNAYLYRDWVIAALNDDLPYDEFIRRQLAADMMEELDEELDDGEIAALGFIGLGPKYYRRNDPEVMADEWEDRVDTVSRGLLGLTVACARCHDHKYDPIGTDDYYALAGVFASTEMFNAPLDGSEVKAEPTKDKKKNKSKSPNAAMHIVREGKVKNVKIHVRGNVKTLGEEVPRGFLQVLHRGDGERRQFQQGSGRLELAEAIVDRQNPLAARVIVNRVWGQLFGDYLVRTPSNFGELGETPTHPELLDDLAVRFMEEGWSLKKLIREIMLSATYRQSSIAGDAALQRDPDNRWLSRMNRRRLSIESWRDGVLSVTGRLANDIGGKSIDVSDVDETRRTIYSRVSRYEMNSMLSMFDFPDPNVHAARRVETTTALQRLFHLNSPFVVAQSEKLATRVEQLDADFPERVGWIYQLLYARAPDEDELALAARFLEVEEDKLRKQRWQQYAQLLLISNEMMYLD